MKALIILLVFTISNQIRLFSAEPIVDLPEMPSKEVLEFYEDSQELFALKLMEIYQTSLLFKSQLLMMGVTPQTVLPIPTIEDFEDQEMSTLTKYYKIATKLKNQVIETPGELPFAKIEKCKQALNDTITHFYKERSSILNNELSKKNEEIRYIDSTYRDLIVKLEEYNSQPYYNRNSLFSIAVIGNVFLSTGEDRFSNTPGLGVRAALNSINFLGVWDWLEFWYEFMSPRVETITNSPLGEIQDRWNSNWHSFGIATNFKPIINSNSFSDGIRFGLGYYWVDADIYNKPNGFIQWNGGRLDLEYFAGKPSGAFPLEFLFGLSILYSFDDDLIINTQYPNDPGVNLGRTQLNVRLGIKYNFWESPF